MTGTPVPAGEMLFRTDETLFAAAPKRELRRKQIADLYDEVRPSLFAYLMGMGIRADRAEDIVQEAFLRLVRHLLSGGKEDNLPGWLFRVAHNLCIDMYRSDQRIFFEKVPEDEVGSSDHISSQPTPEQTYLHNEYLMRIRLAMSRLTPRQRSCVLLRAERLRYRDIAPVLGVSVQRVCRLMSKALGRLAEEL